MNNYCINKYILKYSRKIFLFYEKNPDYLPNEIV